MVAELKSPTKPEIIYPDSDGQPMSDNTEHFQLIVLIKENLEILFSAEQNVFVAGDLLWYTVEGDNQLRQAPDVMVAFGRPKGRRGSYQQWQEENIAPQVVFEILSPGNRPSEMAKKFQFYDRYGVEEYYLYDPDRLDLTGWLRQGEKLAVIDRVSGWVSPRLGIKFELTESGLELIRPDGQKFLTSQELAERAEAESQRAEAESQRAEKAEERVKLLEARLRELNINPEDL
ncbi:Uma2 family endonuclease [Planktothricoides raciborskii]|uniref:Uma2 family endonuclease n=1 Tax=Planktothricoides raciborskii GIHE-MW2 TaxID=2792601 RepID=A0AAU8JHC4_9CYAN